MFLNFLLTIYFSYFSRILLHELGHYITAKIFKSKAELYMGNNMFRIKGKDFNFSIIALSGYILIQNYNYTKKQSIIVALSGLFMNLIYLAISIIFIDIYYFKISLIFNFIIIISNMIPTKNSDLYKIIKF